MLLHELGLILEVEDELAIHTACLPDAVVKCERNSNTVRLKTTFGDHLVPSVLQTKSDKRSDIFVQPMPLLN